MAEYGDYREIPLSRGYVALVDAEDYDDLARFGWYAAFSGHESGPYAKRSFRVNGQLRSERMHRRLLPDSTYVDHINGNGLDNRRSNLRTATNSQNLQNRTGLAASNTSGYRGVRRRPGHRKWEARITIDSQTIHLGRFTTAEDAARAFDAAAISYFGDFAGYLNFPDQAVTR